jgi:hypothetical protein
MLRRSKHSKNEVVAPKEEEEQEAHVTEFILSDNCSTCFGRHHHPFSGAQNNCNYSIW